MYLMSHSWEVSPVSQQRQISSAAEATLGREHMPVCLQVQQAGNAGAAEEAEPELYKADDFRMFCMK